MQNLWKLKISGWKNKQKNLGYIVQIYIETSHNSHVFGVQFWKRAVHRVEVEHGWLGIEDRYSTIQSTSHWLRQRLDMVKDFPDSSDARCSQHLNLHCFHFPFFFISLKTYFQNLFW